MELKLMEAFAALILGVILGLFIAAYARPCGDEPWAPDGAEQITRGAVCQE